MSEYRSKIKEYLQSELKKSNCEGYVIGISGGIDSAVLAHLAAEAVGKNNVLGIFIPINSLVDTNRSALRIFEETKIKKLDVNLSKGFGFLEKEIFETDIVPSSPAKYFDYIKGNFTEKDKTYLNLDNLQEITSNLKARLRMATLYAHAQKNNYLVLGTTNRAEYYLGYFTKHGDGAADLYPLLDFSKKDIYNLAKELKVNPRVVERSPSADLFEGQTDEKDLGFKYSDLEKFFNHNLNNKDIQKKIYSWHNKTNHKRKLNYLKK